MGNINEKLHEIFGSFKARLIAIDDINPELVSPNPSGDLYLSDALTAISSFSPESVLPFLDNLSTRVLEIISDKTKRKKKIDTHFKRTNPDSPFQRTAGADIANPTLLAKNYNLGITNELRTYAELLNSSSLRLHNDILLYGQSIKSDKLQFNLSIKELAIFFRLLTDHKILTTDSYVELANQINIHLTSKGGGGKTDSLVKLISSNEFKYFEFWENKFAELSKLAHFKKLNSNDKTK